jgi:hypothetical protein
LNGYNLVYPAGYQVINCDGTDKSSCTMPADGTVNHIQIIPAGGSYDGWYTLDLSVEAQNPNLGAVLDSTYTLKYLEQVTGDPASDFSTPQPFTLGKLTGYVSRDSAFPSHIFEYHLVSHNNKIYNFLSTIHSTTDDWWTLYYPAIFTNFTFTN